MIEELEKLFPIGYICPSVEFPDHYYGAWSECRKGEPYATKEEAIIKSAQNLTGSRSKNPEVLYAILKLKGLI